jgi:hypothetical protein
MIFSSLLLAVLAVGHPSQANSAADKLLGADKSPSATTRTTR